MIENILRQARMLRQSKEIIKPSTLNRWQPDQEQRQPGSRDDRSGSHCGKNCDPYWPPRMTRGHSLSGTNVFSSSIIRPDALTIDFMN